MLYELSLSVIANFISGSLPLLREYSFRMYFLCQLVECKSNAGQIFWQTSRRGYVTVVSRLDIVPYIRTFVQYDGTFGAPD